MISADEPINTRLAACNIDCMSFRNERKKASYSTLAVITTPILTVREWCTELVGLNRRRERKSHQHDRPRRHLRAIHGENDLG